MDKTKEFLTISSEIEKKSALIDVIRDAIGNLKWNYDYAVSSLEETEEKIKEYIESYEGDDIENDYYFKEYNNTLEKNRNKLDAYIEVQKALMKLV